MQGHHSIGVDVHVYNSYATVCGMHDIYIYIFQCKLCNRCHVSDVFWHFQGNK